MRTILKLRQSIIKDNRIDFQRSAETFTLIGIFMACLFAINPII